MRSRALKAVLLSLSLASIVCLQVSMSGGILGELSASRWLSIGSAAYAETPVIPIRYRVVADRSEARYRIREQLAGFTLPNDAVGTTNAIEGRIALDPQGQVFSNDSRLTVDLRKLQSDRDRRDNYIRRNTLETARYPTAVFVPTEVRGLPFPLPQSGTASFELSGDFTVRDATRRISWQATATFKGHDVNVQATTAFRFADFGLTIPKVASVLSVEDNIQIETDLWLQPSS